MANLYGVATPNPLPIFATTIGSANIVCPAGVETNVIALVFNPALCPGWYYPNVWGFICIANGATGPTTINFGLRLGAGADIINYAGAGGFLTANLFWGMGLVMAGTPLIVSNPYGANTFNVTVNPGGQSVTVSQGGTEAAGQWMRAPDQ